jgi:hypothetical protein
METGGGVGGKASYKEEDEAHSITKDFLANRLYVRHPALLIQM